MEEVTRSQCSSPAFKDNVSKYAEPYYINASAGAGAHLTVVAELVTLLLALMGADDELQVVPVQEVLGDVGAPVAAPTPHLVGNAAVLGHWVAPQQVQDLEAVDTKGSSLNSEAAGYLMGFLNQGVMSHFRWVLVWAVNIKTYIIYCIFSGLYIVSLCTLRFILLTHSVS